MKLSKRVVKQLEQLASTGPAEIEAVILSDRLGGYIVSVPADGQEPGAAITVEAYDRYSAGLRQLEVSFDQLSADASRGADYLRHCAEQITRRLTYLEEPLALLELAAEDKLAQLRSQPPHQEDESLTYWEALIWAEPQPHLKLARYRWTPGQAEREQVVYPATFATVGRIAQDLALSLKG
jgi:hypothetical protein